MLHRRSDYEWGKVMERSNAYPSIGQAIGLLLLFLVLQVAGSVPAAVIFHGPVAATTAVVNLLACGVVLWWGLKRTNRGIEEVLPLTGFRLALIVPMTLAVVGLHILLSEVDNATRWFLPMPHFIGQMMSELHEEGIATFLALVVVAPLTEEFLFRGLILGGFLRRYRVTKSIVVSSVLFAAIHLNPYQFAAAFALGILMGWLYIKTRSLLPCIFVHALANGAGLIASNVLKLDIPGYTGGPDAPAQFQPIWFDALGFVMFAFGMVALITMLKSEPTENGNLPVNSGSDAPYEDVRDLD